jgi:hypothetical protein
MGNRLEIYCIGNNLNTLVPLGLMGGSPVNVFDYGKSHLWVTGARLFTCGISLYGVKYSTVLIILRSVLSDFPFYPAFRFIRRAVLNAPFYQQST